MKALFWSGGDDSTLLLAQLREQGEQFDIIQIRDLWTKEQKKRSDSLITKWGLKVYSYAPIEINLIGQGDEISSVWEYAVGGSRVPMLRDLVPGTRCIAELEGPRMSYSPANWDTHYVGSRKEDTHYATGSVIPGPTWKVGRATFIAPLYDYSKEDVERELKKRNIEPTREQGNIEMCSLCLEGETFCPKEGRVIPQVKWDRAENLKEFRRFYGISRVQQ